MEPLIQPQLFFNNPYYKDSREKWPKASQIYEQGHLSAFTNYVGNPKTPAEGKGEYQESKDLMLLDPPG